MEGDNEVEHYGRLVIDWDKVDKTIGIGKREDKVNED